MFDSAEKLLVLWQLRVQIELHSSFNLSKPNSTFWESTAVFRPKVSPISKKSAP